MKVTWYETPTEPLQGTKQVNVLATPVVREPGGGIILGSVAVVLPADYKHKANTQRIMHSASRFTREHGYRLIGFLAEEPEKGQTRYSLHTTR